MIFNKTALALGVASTLLLASCANDDTPDTGAPTSTITDTETNESPVVTSIVLNGTILTATATDDQSVGALTYTWTVAGVPLNGTGALITAPSLTGQNLVSVFATDAGGEESLLKQMSINFGDDTDPGTVVNEAPVVTDIALSGKTLIATSHDDSSDALTYTWTIAGSVIAGTSAYVVAPIGTVGSKSVTVIATDSKGLSSVVLEELINFGTEDEVVNTAPVVTDIALSSTILVATATDDQDVTALTYSWVIAGSAVVGSGAFITIPDGLTGDNLVTVTATDAAGKTSTLKQVLIDFGTGPGTVNTAPIVTDIALSGSSTLVASATDDQATSALTYAWTVAGNAIVGSGALITAPAGLTGEILVSVIATDAEGKSSTLKQALIDFGTGVDVNTAPVVTDIVLSDTTLTATAIDDEAVSALTYSWTVAGSTVVGSGAFVTAPSGVTGSKLVSVIATDADGLSRQALIDFGSTTTTPDDGLLPVYEGEIDILDSVQDSTPIGGSVDYQTVGNPFKDAHFYVSPDIKTMIDENSLNQSDITVSTDPNSMYQKMLYTQRMPSAVWMDATATIYGSNE
ncbi:MAG: hypothetical protein HRT95_20510 [Moritella sp.]|uniref:hypothetical protein n=1 Tax=Moritella sp. TaxID=78556 RepID=UPI001D404535|nr:hypothetical protein [Moritella sp.]NQZ52458.1 hypothetical protein [Moritella sp.]